MNSIRNSTIAGAVDGECLMVLSARKLLVLLIVLLGSEKQALAYTDPGTGALALQMFLATLVGAMYYGRRLLRWLLRRGGKPAKNGKES
jgi:hypothetical protein